MQQRLWAFFALTLIFSWSIWPAAARLRLFLLNVALKWPLAPAVL